jgi:D-glycero-beta-D-manno-heptose-7-phosphate kinase
MDLKVGKVLVVGDSCTDIFIYGDITRICPEAPVPIINPTHQTKNGGMASNVAANLNSLGVKTKLITNLNTINKTRYIDNRSNQQVLRVDDSDYCDQLDDKLLTTLDIEYDAVIISDYCKGFLSESHIKYICDTYDNVFVDTKKRLGAWILNADYIKINEFEYSKTYASIPEHPELIEKLIVTKGKDGCEYNGEIFTVKEVSVRDVSGAGDTFISGLVAEYIKSKNIRNAIKFAQECTSKVVQKAGVTTV